MTDEQREAGYIEILTYSSGSLSFVADMQSFMSTWLDENNYDKESSLVLTTPIGWQVIAKPKS